MDKLFLLTFEVEFDVKTGNPSKFQLNSCKNKNS